VAAGELKASVKRDKLETPSQLRAALAGGLQTLLAPLEQTLDAGGHQPFVIMIAGVNGAGKTTSIGKLAKHFQSQGKSVLLAAGDTFRAAAREQLTAWGERNGITVIAQESGDPAAVVFDAINAARARKIDVVLADTAGRLPTQLHLMEEIAKVRRVIKKADDSGPHEVLLVLDANIGQNAVQQVKAFDKAIGVTGLIVTKLDGTAKGGVLAAIARQCPKPVRFIGVGEGIDDLQAFRAGEFVEALLGPARFPSDSVRPRFEALPAGPGRLVRPQLRGGEREMAVVSGHSGAGKSTLLKLIAAVEKPTGGAVLVGGQNIGGLSRSALPFVRRRIGMVFQDQKLLFDRSVFENVMLPLSIAGFRPGMRHSAFAPRWTRSASPPARKPCRSCSPAASSSAWRSPAPWWAGPACCWPTNPPRISTRYGSRCGAHLSRVPRGRRHHPDRHLRRRLFPGARRLRLDHGKLLA
jgi:signal recognition particle-docking protein FtsY